MRQKRYVQGLFGVGLAVLSLTGLSPLAAQADSTGDRMPGLVAPDGRSIPLIRDEKLTAIRYPDSLTSQQARSLALQDVEDLGLNILYDRIGINQIIVEADEASVRNALRSRSAAGPDPILRPVYFISGARHEQTAIVVYDQITVGFREDQGIDARADLMERFGLTLQQHLFGNTYVFNTNVSAGKSVAIAEAIKGEFADRIEFAEIVFDMPMQSHWSTALPAGDAAVNPAQRRGRDPLVGLQWHLANAGSGSFGNATNSVPDADMDIPRFWNPNTRPAGKGDGRRAGYFGNQTTGRQVIVAVFDSGTDLAHENWRTNTNDPYNQTIRSTVIDSRIGRNFVTANPLPDAQSDAHGTAVAGIISGARNNGTGTVGIAPSTQLFTLRVGGTDTGFANTAQLASAVNEATSVGADVGNHSYGGPIISQAFGQAFDLSANVGRNGRGMVHFAATGNDGTNLEQPAYYPAVFAVGGVGPEDKWVNYASWGGRIDFVGPTQQGGPAGPFTSSAIVTMDISGVRGYDVPNLSNPLNMQGNYTFGFNGTSAASPMVAGAAALILAERPTLTAYAGPNSLFDVMARTSDRPEDARRFYFPRDSKAARVTYIEELPPPPPEEEEGGEVRGHSTPAFVELALNPAQARVANTIPGSTVKTEVFGNPSGFRRSLGFQAEGFSFFHGYGRPNPIRAILDQPANSPYLYNASLAESDHMETGLVAGEVVLAYQSNFLSDYLAMLNACLGELFEEAPPEDIDDFELLANCILGNTEQTSWRFTNIRASWPDEDTGPREMGFMPSADELTAFFLIRGFLPQNYFSRHPFEFGSNFPIEDAIEENIFPIVISSSRIPVGEFEPGDPGYNPRGRVLPNRTYNFHNEMTILEDESTFRVEALPVPSSTAGMELTLEITMRYELNEWFPSAGNGDLARYADGESIVIQAGPNTFQIRGQSHNEPVPIPQVAIGRAEVDFGDNTINVPIWGPEIVNNQARPYYFERSTPEILYRTFRFPAGISNGRYVNFDFTLNTLNAVYPEWEFNDQGEFEQILEAPQRGLRGFRVADIKVWATNPAPAPGSFLAGEDYFKPRATRPFEFGTRPVFTRNGNEVVYLGLSNIGVPATIKVTETNQFNRRVSATNPEAVELIRNPQINLLTVCSGGPASSVDFPDCAQTLVTSLDADFKSNRIAYVATKDPGQPRVFITTDDGFDERPVFRQAVNGQFPDEGATEAVFGRNRPVVFFTDGTRIRITAEDGSEVATLFDGTVDKVRNITGLTSRDSDFLFAFAAQVDDSDFGIYYSIEGVNVPGIAQFFQPIVNWPNSVEAQPHFSPDGRRMLFVSNTIDRELGSVPPVEAPFRLYSVENVEQVILFGAAPQIRVLDMLRDTRGLPGAGSSDQYVSALFPRFNSAGDRITFVGYPFPGTLASSNGFGEIATVLYSGSPIQAPTTPTPFVPEPTPITPPQPTPTPEPATGITPAGLYTFDAGGDGWQFIRVEDFIDPRGEVVDNSLVLQSQNDNMNTFGFYRSPLRALRLFDPGEIVPDTFVDAEGNVIARGPFAERLGSHYLVRYYMRRIGADRNQIADARVRVNNLTLQDYHTRGIPSNGPGSYVPATDQAGVLDLLFHPSPYAYLEAQDNQYYFLNFDMFNIAGANDPNSGYILDRVEIFRVPLNEMEELGRFRVYDFNTAADVADWEFRGLPELGFDPMEGSVAGDSLSISVPDPGFALGYWQTLDGALTVDPTNIPGKLYVRMRMFLRASEVDPTRVPEFRLNLGQTDFNNITQVGLVGTGSGRFIPTLNNPRVITAYLEIPSEWVGPFPLISLFEAHSFSETQSSAPIFLDRVEYELVRVRNYPAPVPNP